MGAKQKTKLMGRNLGYRKVTLSRPEAGIGMGMQYIKVSYSFDKYLLLFSNLFLSFLFFSVTHWNAVLNLCCHC